jgi:diguanylate cyclase
VTGGAVLSRDDLLAAASRAPAGGGADGTSALLVLRLPGQRELRTEFGYADADRIAAAARALIGAVLRPGDRYCRLADDAYALLLPGLRSENHAALAAARLARAFRAELQHDGAVLPCQVAIGMTLLDGATPPQRLLRQADLAAAAAERSGEAVRRCTPLPAASDVSATELRAALAANRLEAWLQPLWSLREQRVVGAESLARWTCPQRGEVSPALFVPLAERCDLIGELTRWSLHASLRHCQQARRIDPAVEISVNLSPRLLIEHDLVEQVEAALRLWDIPPRALTLEITEGALMHDARRSARLIEQFRAAGIGIALDDFGSGYSSFGYLREFEATELKIDQSFVRSLRHDRRDRQLVRSMIDLAHHLDMRVVAEGVEDAATLAFVHELGCDLAQGNHVAAALPVERFLELLGADVPAA